MKTFTRTPILAGLAAALAAASAGVSLAQTPPAAPPGAERAHAEHRDRMHARMQARRAERAKALHDALSLRPDQEGAWREFQAAMQPPPHAERRKMDPDQRAALTTPQRLDLMSQRMSERQAQFQRRADATKRFYAALTPQQQKTFDALHRMHGPGMRGPGGMGGPFGHGGWGGGWGWGPRD